MTELGKSIKTRNVSAPKSVPAQCEESELSIGIVFYNARIIGDDADRDATYGIAHISLSVLAADDGARHFMVTHLREIPNPLPEECAFELRSFSLLAVTGGNHAPTDEAFVQRLVLFFNAVAHPVTERCIFGTFEINVSDLRTDDWLNRVVLSEIRARFTPPLEDHEEIDLRALSTIGFAR